MDILELRRYCLSLPLAEECTPFDETTLVFKIGGKMFCYTDMVEFRWIAVKCDPDRGPVRSGTCAAACRSFTSLTTDRRQARHCSPAERRGCRIFRRLSPCYGPSNCPFSMGNRTKSGKSKFSVDFDKAIVYNLRTTPKIMDLT